MPAAQTAFATAVFLHDMLAGTHPIPCYPSDYIDKLGFVVYEDGDVRVRLPAYPDAFRSILSDMLCIDPRRRISVAVSVLW